MTRQSEKNLLITVAALATTAIVVVVFNSSPAENVSSVRSRRETGDDDDADAPNPIEFGSPNFDVDLAWDTFVDSMADDEQWSKSGEEEALRAGRRKKNKGKKPAGFNPNKISQGDLTSAREQMDATVASRRDSLALELEMQGPTVGGPDPEAGVNLYKGDAVNPVVQGLMDESSCGFDNTASVHFMYGSTLPIAEAEPIKAYENYAGFVSRFAAAHFPTNNGRFKFSANQYSSNNGYKVKKISAKYRSTKDADALFKGKSALFSAMQPNLNLLARNLRVSFLEKNRVAPSTPSAGQDCFLVWFLHEIPTTRGLFDASTVQNFEDLHNMCTVIPIYIGPESTWGPFVSVMNPARQFTYAKDAKFNGEFIVDTLADLNTDAMVEKLANYMCMVKERNLCRCQEAAYVPPPPETADYEAPADDFRGIDDYSSSEEETGATDAPAETAGTDSPPALQTAAPVPEIDRCCGHTALSTPYDSNLKACCADGKATAYAADGSDPCEGL